MSSSDVFRAANSNAKFGAIEYDLLLLASNCIHRAGRCRNATGLISTAGTPNRTGAQIPRYKPIS
jgi:hypothetical protein